MAGFLNFYGVMKEILLLGETFASVVASLRRGCVCGDSCFDKSLGEFSIDSV